LNAQVVGKNCSVVFYLEGEECASQPDPLFGPNCETADKFTGIQAGYFGAGSVSTFGTLWRHRT